MFSNLIPQLKKVAQTLEDKDLLAKLELSYLTSYRIHYCGEEADILRSTTARRSEIFFDFPKGRKVEIDQHEYTAVLRKMHDNSSAFYPSDDAISVLSEE